MKRGSYNRRSQEAGKTSKKLPQLVGRKDPFFGLQYLADQFNQLRTPEKLASDELDAWGQAEWVASGVVADPQPKLKEGTTILTRGLPLSLETAIELFNFSFENALVRLCLWPPKKGYELEVLPGMDIPRDSKAPLRAHVAIALWWHFFREEGWKRMHRCQVCRNWIVARGRNKVICYCSPGCTWKHWDWKQRGNHPSRTNATSARKRKKGRQQ
jgi:hypothetical protein